MQSNSSGYTEWLLFHLWKPNPYTGESCVGLNIPHTVFYKWSKPYLWYSTTESGQLQRNAKKSVNHQQIYKDFLKSNESIKAVLLSFSESTATMEYLTFESFEFFINNRAKPYSGMIQKWVRPKGESNSLIKAVWTNQFCLIEKRVNKHSIDNTRVPFYDKLVTYEGLEHLSINKRVTMPSLISKIQNLCLNIQNHLTAVSGGNVSISKMTLYFKLDDNNKLWFFFCSSLRTVDLLGRANSYGSNQELTLTVPCFTSLPSQSETNHCLACGKAKKLSGMYPITLRMIILASDRGKLRGGVPEVVSRMDPSIDENKYNQLKNSPSWPYEEIKVCEDCYLKFTKYYLQPRVKTASSARKPRTIYSIPTEPLPETNLAISHEMTLSVRPELVVKKPKVMVRNNIISATNLKTRTVIKQKKSETKIKQCYSKRSFHNAANVYGHRPKTQGSQSSTKTNSEFSSIFDAPTDVKNKIIGETIYSLRQAVLNINQ